MVYLLHDQSWLYYIICLAIFILRSGFWLEIQCYLKLKQKMWASFPPNRKWVMEQNVLFFWLSLTSTTIHTRTLQQIYSLWHALLCQRQKRHDNYVKTIIIHFQIIFANANGKSEHSCYTCKNSMHVLVWYYLMSLRDISSWPTFAEQNSLHVEWPGFYSAKYERLQRDERTSNNTGLAKMSRNHWGRLASTHHLPSTDSKYLLCVSLFWQPLDDRWVLGEYLTYSQLMANCVQPKAKRFTVTFS